MLALKRCGLGSNGASSRVAQRVAAPDVPGDPFEALGDPNRRQILRLLSDGDKPVQEIAGSMPISRPAVSRHLRLLKDAGMVAEQAHGTRRIYHLQEQGLPPFRPIWRASGATPPSGSDCWPRTPRKLATR